MKLPSAILAVLLFIAYTFDSRVNCQNKKKTIDIVGKLRTILDDYYGIRNDADYENQEYLDKENQDGLRALRRFLMKQNSFFIISLGKHTNKIILSMVAN